MRLRLLLCLAAAIPAAAETIDPVNDLRFGVAVQMAPKVSENITPASGEAKRYNWEDGKAWGLRYDVMYVQGMSQRGRPASGFLWAVGASYGSTDITPGKYDTGGASSDNTREDVTLKYRQYGVTGGVGWASMPTDTEIGDLNWEILAIGRGGLCHAQTVAPGLSGERGEDDGRFWEAGATAGLVVTDSGWIFGLYVGWLYGRGSVHIDLPNDSTSSLRITRNGAEAGAQLGFRF